MVSDAIKAVLWYCRRDVETICRGLLENICWRKEVRVSVVTIPDPETDETVDVDVYYFAYRGFPSIGINPEVPPLVDIVRVELNNQDILNKLSNHQYTYLKSILLESVLSEYHDI